MCIKNKQNSLYSTDVFLLWYFHPYVSAGKPAIFTVTFLLQEYSVMKRVKLQTTVPDSAAAPQNTASHSQDCSQTHLPNVYIEPNFVQFYLLTLRIYILFYLHVYMLKILTNNHKNFNIVG
jgi:hypothetical protein